MATFSCESKQAEAACTRGSANCLPDVKYVDTDGVAYTPESLAGKVVVVNFWATWCKPCMKEIPDLSKVYEKYKGQGLVMLGVLASDNPDNATLLNFRSDNEMTFPVVRANSDILISYEYPGSLPTTFVFDRQGRRVTSNVGAMRAEKLTEILDPLLAAK
ncbi:MAG TPA: TlpA disulfide reductase family protein [Kofleriaceae bacterium]|nr:TlpA disulfide reductase family protein [Kofleriaceae bacterium]